jgi:hypothetical protein
VWELFSTLTSFGVSAADPLTLKLAFADSLILKLVFADPLILMVAFADEEEVEEVDGLEDLLGSC